MKNYSAKEHLEKVKELIENIGKEKESIVFMLLFEFFESGGDKFKEKNKTIYRFIEDKVDDMGYDGDEKKLKNVQDFFFKRD
jgi:uncharacterized protein YpuA (DUF1002 family)